MNPQRPEDDKGFILPPPKGKVLQPLSTAADTPDEDVTPGDVIRKKISTLYADEPDAQEEAVEAAHITTLRSPHQEFMHQLTVSGKSAAEIHTAWHTYYTNLDDAGKREVWKEFYAAQHDLQEKDAALARVTTHTPETDTPQHHDVTHQQPQPVSDRRSVSEIQRSIRTAITAPQKHKLSASQHIKSLLFGLSVGGVVLIIFLFGFFNQAVIAPFITPSSTVSASSIIINPNDTTAPNDKPDIIIPKINVEIPVVYTVPTINENQIELGLEHGVVHYPTTPNPGQLGNAVIFGHSSNNILNPGHYKFAFVLLHNLRSGDLFYVDYKGTRYAYKVFERKIVSPNNVSVLGPTSKPATVTLITCDPPGTSINRLIVVGEQISPSPSKDTKGTLSPSAPVPKVLPSNSPSLWGRIWQWVTGQTVTN